MTIERQYGKIIFICDVNTSPQCEGQIETDEREFLEALRFMKAAGWGVAPMTGGGWMHNCGKRPRPR